MSGDMFLGMHVSDYVVLSVWGGGGGSTFADKQYVTGEVGAADLCGGRGGLRQCA